MKLESMGDGGGSTRNGDEDGGGRNKSHHDAAHPRLFGSGSVMLAATRLMVLSGVLARQYLHAERGT